MKLSYLDLTTTDPAYNLAVEQYVFERLPRDRMYFMLWQNDNAIIIGKHQNTLAEINEEFVRERGIRVVRRLSGGGAVYHDMGNLNFTLIADAKDSGELDFRLFCQPVIRALEKMGVKAELNGRNDMTIDGRKFSGNAQYVKDGRVMHHGTILFDSDMSVLGGALKVDEEKIRAKGVKSVRSRVTNVRPHLKADMPLSCFRTLLLESMLEENSGDAWMLTGEDLAAIEKLKRDRYDTWEWNYGASPACTVCRRRRFEGCGMVEAYLTLDHGRITAAEFMGDYFSLMDPQSLGSLLTGHLLEEGELTAALADVEVRQYIRGLSTAQLIGLLLGTPPAD